MNKQILGVFFTITLLLNFNVQTFAYSNDEKIKVGYIENFGTINTPSVKGSEGFFYEYLHQLNLYTHVKYDFEFVKCTLVEAFEKLESGEIALLCGVNSTPEIQSKFILSEKSFGEEGIYIASSLDNDAFFNDFEELSQSTIAVQSEGDSVSLLKNFFLEHNLPVPEIIDIGLGQHTTAVDIGIYEYCMLSSIQYGHNLKAVALIDKRPLYIIANKEFSSVMDDLNNARDILDFENIIFDEKLFMKYFSSNLQVAPITRNEYEYIQQKNVLNIGYTSNYAPLSYHDENGLPTGVFVDVVKMIADICKLDTNFIELDFYDPNLDTSNIDISISLLSKDGSTIKTSIPYINVPFVLIERSKGISGSSSIGMLTQYNYEETKLQSFLKDADVSLFDTMDNLKTAINTRLIDTLILSNLTLNELYDGINDIANFSITPLDSTLDIGVSFGKNIDDETISIINKAIASLDDTSLDYLLTKHITLSPKNTSLLDIFKTNVALRDTILVFVLISSFFFILAEIKKRKTFYSLTNFDFLTGFITERKFIQEANNIISQNPDISYSIISTDIDNFKYINEIYGYEVGSQVIREFAKFMSIPEQSPLLITRRFSDHILIFEQTDKIDFMLECLYNQEKLLQQKIITILGEDYNFSFSMGICDIEKDEHSIDYNIDCSNFACSIGKTTTGKTLYKFTEEMRIERESNNKVVSNMNQALADREFVVVYQPKVCMTTQKINGAEALIRWFKDGKTIPPDEFIPVFEKNGFIEKLDYYVLEEVCKFISSSDRPLPVISLNLSGITIMQEDLVDVIISIITKYGIRPEQLDLEITESAFVSNFDKSIGKLDTLREMWFKISIDDFGAGISSLNRLKNIPLDILKIDREFIVGSIDNEKGQTIIKNIVQMAKDLDLETVAEGIETIEQYEFLKKLGCDVGQGYYFSRPLPANEFLESFGLLL